MFDRAIPDVWANAFVPPPIGADLAQAPAFVPTHIAPHIAHLVHYQNANVEALAAHLEANGPPSGHRVPGQSNGFDDFRANEAILAQRNYGTVTVTNPADGTQATISAWMYFALIDQGAVQSTTTYANDGENGQIATTTYNDNLTTAAGAVINQIAAGFMASSSFVAAAGTNAQGAADGDAMAVATGANPASIAGFSAKDPAGITSFTDLANSMTRNPNYLFGILPLAMDPITFAEMISNMQAPDASAYSPIGNIEDGTSLGLDTTGPTATDNAY